MLLGVLGGTFNPIHYGHLRAAEEVLELLGLDEVLFVPAGVPPFKSEDLAPAADRIEMVRLAVESNERFRVLDMEAKREGTSYTVDTLVALRQIYPGDRLVFIVGVDAFLELPLWKDSERLMRSVDFAILRRLPFPAEALAGRLNLSVESLMALGRGGILESPLQEMAASKAYVLGNTAHEISSTDIRNRVRRGRNISYLLPEAVESFIMTRGLYI